MTFANPLALVLLLVIPYFLWLGRPRLAYRRRRDLASLIARIVIVLSLILALAGVQVVRAADKLAVVFLLDASDSIDQTARTQAEAYIRDALSHMSPEDRAALIVFGQNALVERPLSASKELGVISSAPIRLNTNIAGAVRLALALFPADAARRIVLLSDGDQTVDNALNAAQLAVAANVQIDTVALPRHTGADMAVTDVRAPSKVNTGEQFDLGVTVQSQSDATANLTVLAGGAVVTQKVVQLKTGANNFVFTLSVTTQGFDDFRVRVDPLTADTFYQNNELSGFTEVTGPPRVLLVSSTPDEIGALLPALQTSGLQVDIVAPGDMPTAIAALAGYKSVILANVSATVLTTQRMKILQSYVRDLGGGLVTIGGPNSYGVGGYYQTPLEETLPVEMRIKDQKRVPKLTMVYVIDRSGSMEEIGPSQVTNLELAKEASRRSINFLYAQDRAGVLSFDSNPEWLVPIQYVTNQAAMDNQIGTLRPGGGTDIYAAVKEIMATLPSDPSTLKHVILLTDGGADPTGIVDMVAQMNQQFGITVTTVGIGSQVPPFMADIAKAGKGIYYNLVDLQTIPQIFAAETVLATRSYIVEKPFVASFTADTPMLNGINGLPQLLGYVAVTAKDTATVSLKVPGYDDPLLASWQYGLGKAVAFMSDASGRWAKNWTSWDQFGRFWSQVVHYTVSDSGVGNKLESHIEQRGDQSVLVVDARDAQGGFLNSLTLQASVVDPQLGAQLITLQQVAPGRYETPVDPQKEGAYFIRVGGSNPNDTTSAAAQTLGWVLSYSPEYRLHNTNFRLLDDLAQLTGGQTVIEHADKVFVHDLHAEQAATPLWPYLLLLAALLLPFDIAIRRLILTRSDLQKASAWTTAKLGIQARPVLVPVTAPRMTRLMDAKERAGSINTVTGGTVTGSAVTNTTTNTAPPITPIDAIPTPSSAASLTPPVPPASNTSGKPTGTRSVADNTLASRLLEQRRKNRGD